MDTIPILKKPGDLSKDIIRTYLRDKRLNPSNFEELLSTLDNQPTTRSVLESVGLKKVIDTQMQAYNCMSDAITDLQQGLRHLHQAYGNLNRILREIHQVSPIYLSYKTGITSPGTESELVTLFPIHEIEGLTELIEMNREVNQKTFLQIKDQNWEIFKKNIEGIRKKAYDADYGILKLRSELQIM